PAERPHGHGTFGTARVLRAGAAFTFTGWYQGGTWAETLEQIAEFNRILRPTSTLLVTVEDDRGPTSREVIVHASPVRENMESRDFTFAIDMTSEDPLRYGPTSAVVAYPPTAGGGLV